MPQILQTQRFSDPGISKRILSVREAAAFLGVSKSFLDKRRLSGDGPTYLKLGSRVGYDPGDLNAWAHSTRRRHTAESGSVG